ncbi:transcriptional regulator [Dinoroseobacter phage vB_DshS-R4C]|nr:transcriptional regulator [Dinoroseobacter phage vB_DshS-R4C]
MDDTTLSETLRVHGETGNAEATAAALGVHRSTVFRRLAKASLRGLDGSVPRPIPPGQTIRGVSTLYGRDGKVAATWVKTQADRLSLPDIAEAIRDAVGTTRAPVTPPPSAGSEDLLAVFPWPDLHLGMYAWGSETGEDYDLEIAEGLVRGVFASLLDRAPDAAHAVILGLGDITHADDETASTRRSGNRLDVDTRHQKVLTSTLRLLVWAISAALERFPRVTVRLLKGNHDEQTAAALSVALALFYEAEPRVTVDDSPSLWWFLRHGQTLLGATHGHTCKAEAMPGVMASDRAADWGATRHRYVLHGHLHHRRVIETMGVPAECFQTIAPKDAYHAGAGYVSGRSMMGIAYHAQGGEWSRWSVNLPGSIPAERGVA